MTDFGTLNPSSSEMGCNDMQQDKKVEQPQNEVKQEPTLSIPVKVILVVFMAMLVTLFVLMWKGLGGGPIITPRSAL